MHLNELKALHVSEVLKQAKRLRSKTSVACASKSLMFAIIKKRAKAGEQVFADGVLEILPDGFGFLRSPDTSYTASTDDIYISPSQVRRFNLHTGDMIEGEVRTPKDGERYFALTKLDSVNGGSPEQNKHKVLFENLTPLFPPSSCAWNVRSRARRTSPAASSTSSPHRPRPARADRRTAQERQDHDDAEHRPLHHGQPSRRAPDGAAGR